MKRILLVLLSLALLASGMTSPVHAQTSSHRYVVFLAGLCPWTNSDPYCHGQIDAEVRARATFRTLIADMKAAHLGYTPLYFSYAAGRTYTVRQTHQSVGAAAALLTADIRATRAQDPDASFILIGHSLGGVIAARWASMHPTSPAASIVTFDSPLRGIRGGSALARVFGGDVWTSLQPGSQSIRSITSQPTRWWQTTGHLHTVANTADVLVPPGEALLGARHTVTDSSCPVDLLVVRSCHGAVLSDTALNTWVVSHWLAPPVAPTLPPPAPSPTAAP